MTTAREYAADRVGSVRDDPAGRLALMRSLYEPEPGHPELHLPYAWSAGELEIPELCGLIQDGRPLLCLGPHRS